MNIDDMYFVEMSLISRENWLGTDDEFDVHKLHLIEEEGNG